MDRGSHTSMKEALAGRQMLSRAHLDSGVAEVSDTTWYLDAQQGAPATHVDRSDGAGAARQQAERTLQPAAATRTAMVEALRA
jgi:hypothetical protein